MTWWLAGAALAAPQGWEVLQSEQVAVRCQGLEAPTFRCEASAVLAAPPDTVWQLVRDPARFPDVFPSIQGATARSDGRYDVAVSLPWPLPAWPLVVEATVFDGARQLALADVGGGKGVWDRAEIEVHPHAQGSELRWAWTGRPLVGWLHRRVQKTYGHNTVWAVAQALDVTPRAPGLATDAG